MKFTAKITNPLPADADQGGVVFYDTDIPIFDRLLLICGGNQWNCVRGHTSVPKPWEDYGFNIKSRNELMNETSIY